MVAVVQPDPIEECLASMHLWIDQLNHQAPQIQANTPMHGALLMAMSNAQHALVTLESARASRDNARAHRAAGEAVSEGLHALAKAVSGRKARPKVRASQREQLRQAKLKRRENAFAEPGAGKGQATPQPRSAARGDPKPARKTSKPPEPPEAAPQKPTKGTTVAPDFNFSGLLVALKDTLQDAVRAAAERHGSGNGQAPGQPGTGQGATGSDKV